MRLFVFGGATLALVLMTSVATAATRRVAPSGRDSDDCTKAPCKTITYGIAQMAGGDELVIADGVYGESIKNMPSGSAKASTVIRAEHDWGVRIDGSHFADDWTNGISIHDKHYVEVRGFKVSMGQKHENDQPIMIWESDHIKLIRCGGDGAPIKGNAATITVGPKASRVLVEEAYAFGGGRYQILVYWSENVVVRRSVVRNDYWNGSLQCAGFTNYDSVHTTWQNNIALDSDTANCSGMLYGGFFNENKSDYAPDTSETLQGNIVLNVKAFYAGDLDWVMSGTRTIDDMIIWNSRGYHAEQGPGAPANLVARHWTVGSIPGTYDGPNTQQAAGTAFSVYGPIASSLTSSILVENESYGVADYTKSDFNVLFGNGKGNYGGHQVPTPGAHDHAKENKNEIDPRANGLKYLPRIEAGSALSTAGKDGGRAGAEVLFATGADGSLDGDPGWNQPTTRPLWPFPNEAVISEEMGSYKGPGGAGKRGFTSGTSKDGTPQTLTKYIWEYLGNPIPPEIYKGTQAPVAPAPKKTDNPWERAKSAGATRG